MEPLRKLYEQLSDQEVSQDAWQHFLDQLLLPEREEEAHELLRSIASEAGAGMQPMLSLSPEQQEMLTESILMASRHLETAPSPTTRSISSEGGASQRKRNILYRYRAAAAILLLAGCMAVLYLVYRATSGHPRAPEDTGQIADIQPGKKGAFLTLSNGEKVMLDSVPDGVVALQGGGAVKIANGMLVYDGTAGEMVYNTMSTPKGREFRVTLPDGTGVWLNAASSIRYPTVFDGLERKVEVTGEVYFEVAEDKKKPFLVAVNNMSIRVLGTKFNVNAYANESDIATTLLEGSIRLTAGKYQTLLKPGEQALLGKNGQVKVLQQEDMEQVIAWTQGYFNFRNAGLATVMKQLERWYDIDVAYEGEVPERRFQGELPRSLDLSFVLTMLREMKINYRIDGKKLIISK